MTTRQQVMPVEPAIFLAFGLFHLHRVWAFADRQGYAGFWLSQIERRGWFYHLLFLLLAGLCCVGIGLFFRLRRDGARWRWVYPAGGCYLLFDLLAIQLRWPVWIGLLHTMFDTANPYWTVIWGGFCLLGAASLLWGLRLLASCRRYRAQQATRLSRGRVYDLRRGRENQDRI